MSIYSEYSHKKKEIGKSTRTHTPQTLQTPLELQIELVIFLALSGAEFLKMRKHLLKPPKDTRRNKKKERTNYLKQKNTQKNKQVRKPKRKERKPTESRFFFTKPTASTSSDAPADGAFGAPKPGDLSKIFEKNLFGETKLN